MELNKPITIIIIVIVTCMLVFLFVMPQYQQSNDLALALAEKEAQYNGQSQYYANIDRLDEGVQQRQEVLAKIDSALPSELALAPLMYFFQEKSTQSGSSLKSIVFLDGGPVAAATTATGTKTDKSIRTVTFSINLVGNYQALKNFLGALEKSSRIFEVSTIAFSSLKDQKSPAASQGQTYDFRLEVKTYSY